MYLTTAIYYTNGPPHIGHVLEWVLSDVLVKFWKISNSTKVIRFLTGTDEHGQKIAKTAQQLGLTPKELCDKISKEFQVLSYTLGLRPDRFIRTTDVDHRETVYAFIESVQSDIYLGEYTGWYNQREETYITELDAKLAGYKDPVTQTPLQKVSEESFFFKLSRFQTGLIDWLSKCNVIVPATKQKEILDRLQSVVLEDLSITRLSTEWGIPVPTNVLTCSDKPHVLYVWFDALLNYITGNQNWDTTEQIVQVIGKDILWFHAVIWPAMLMAANRKVPDKLICHGFVCDEHSQKMSKSVGNVVDPVVLLEKYPPDVLRGYLVNDFSFGDFSFSESSLIRYNDSLLLANFGNLVNRTFSMLHRYSLGVRSSAEYSSETRYSKEYSSETRDITPVPNVTAVALFDIDSVVNTLTATVCERFEIQSISETFFMLSSTLNKYLDKEKIWNIGKPNDPRAGESGETARQIVLRTTLEGIYVLSHLLWCIAPFAAETVANDFFGKPLQTLTELTWNNLDGVCIKKQNTILFTSFAPTKKK